MRFIVLPAVLSLSLVACAPSGLDGDLETYQFSPPAFRADEVALAAETGEQLAFEVEVTPGTEVLWVATRGGSGDADLTVLSGDTVLCESMATGNDETCEIHDPPVGTVRIVLTAWVAFEGVELDTELVGAASPDPGAAPGTEVLATPVSDGDLRSSWILESRHGVLEWTVTPNDPSVPYDIFLSGGAEWCQDLDRSGVQVCRMAHPVDGAWRAETYDMVGGGSGVLTWTPIPVFLDQTFERPWGQEEVATVVAMPAGATSAVLELVGTDDGDITLQVFRNGQLLCDRTWGRDTSCKLEGQVGGDVEVHMGGFAQDAFRLRVSATP